MYSRLLAAVLLILGLGTILTACSGGGMTSSGQAAPAPGPGVPNSMTLRVEVPSSSNREIQASGTSSRIAVVSAEVVDPLVPDPGTLSGFRVVASGQASVPDSPSSGNSSSSSSQLVDVLILSIPPGNWNVHVFGLGQDGLVVQTASSFPVAITPGIVLVQRVNLGGGTDTGGTTGTTTGTTTGPVAGTLTQVGATLNLGGLAPVPSAITPDGRFLVVPLRDPVSPINSQIAVLDLDPTTGAVSEIQPRVNEDSPEGAAIDPSSGFVYVGTSNLDVNTYSLTNGVLAGPISSVIAPNNGLFGQVLTVGGNTILYYSSSINTAVAAYQVLAGGFLSPLTGSPFNVNTGISPDVIRLNPAGTFLYATEGTVFSVNQATGDLSIIPGSPFTAISTGGLAISPDGQFLYNNSFSQLKTLSLAPDGVPTLVDTRTDVNGFGDVLAERSGRFLYAVNVALNQVNGYTLTAGIPTPLSSTPTGFTSTGGVNAIQLIQHPTLNVIYAISAATSQVSAFSIAP